jgi:hypothetical protein
MDEFMYVGLMVLVGAMAYIIVVGAAYMVLGFNRPPGSKTEDHHPLHEILSASAKK